MERVKIHQLKKAIEETRESCPNPIDKDALDRIMKSVLVCPPQFLRITKMYDSVMKIKRESKSPDAKLSVIQNFQETIAGGF